MDEHILPAVANYVRVIRLNGLRFAGQYFTLIKNMDTRISIL
jgi:hypothetical protein